MPQKKKKKNDIVSQRHSVAIRRFLGRDARRRHHGRLPAKRGAVWDQHDDVFADWCVVVVVFVLSLSSSFELVVSSRIGIRFVSPNDARFDMYIVQKPTGGKLTNQQQRHKKKTTTTTGIAVAFVSLPLHEMRPYQDKRSMTTEKAAAEQHMKDLAEQEKQFKEGKKKK